MKSFRHYGKYVAAILIPPCIFIISLLFSWLFPGNHRFGDSISNPVAFSVTTICLILLSVWILWKLNCNSQCLITLCMASVVWLIWMIAHPAVLMALYGPERMNYTDLFNCVLLQLSAWLSLLQYRKLSGNTKQASSVQRLQ
mgnify:CR=1 FL=1